MKRPCVCKHGYGTHELIDWEDTIIPGPCRAKGCPCVRYARAKRGRSSG